MGNSLRTGGSRNRKNRIKKYGGYTSTEAALMIEELNNILELLEEYPNKETK